MSTSTNLRTKKWAYTIKGSSLYLYEVDDSLGFIPPSLDITDGLKIEYATGNNVFIDSDGDSVSAPDEDSLINVPDTFKKAVIAFVRARMHEDKGELSHLDYWMRQYRIEFSRANEAQLPGPRVAITRSPYAIR